MVVKPRLLLVDDDVDTATQIKGQAKLSGYVIHEKTYSEDVFLAIKRDAPDLLIMGLKPPSENILNLIGKIKGDKELKKIPIIILSMKGDELDVVVTLEAGADDYVPKPISLSFLFARIDVLIKPAKTFSSQIVLGDFILNEEHTILYKHEKVIPLTRVEFGIMRRLATSSGRVLTRNQLLQEIPESEDFLVDRNIDGHITSLRKKLGVSLQAIETVPGVGYRCHL